MLTKLTLCLSYCKNFTNFKKTMFKVLSFGEALVDLLSNNISEKEQDNAPESFTKFPGGAPANGAAVVSRLGGNTFL